MSDFLEEMIAEGEPGFRAQVEEAARLRQRIRDGMIPLTEALAALGYHARESSPAGVRDIHAADGSLVCRGRAHDVWAWLREVAL